MSIHSKALLQGIHKLNSLNLDTHTPFKVITDYLVDKDKHPKDEKITALVTAINKKFGLDDQDQVLYHKNPLSFMGKGMLIGIHNAHGHTYRVLRSENYECYHLLCKNLDKLGMNMFILKDEYLDVIFS